MDHSETNSANQKINRENSISLLEKVTPLATQINCLDINQITDICIKHIPDIVGVNLASLYILDEESNILHLHKHNHPFLINKIVSLNQTPPSPMVMAVKSRELIIVADIDTHKKPVIRRSQRPFAKNYKTKNCAIVPLVCQERVVGVLNLADLTQSDKFNTEQIALIELFSQLVGLR
jgi:GAF domain-containing protein